MLLVLELVLTLVELWVPPPEVLVPEGPTAPLEVVAPAPPPVPPVLLVSPASHDTA